MDDHAASDQVDGALAAGACLGVEAADRGHLIEKVDHLLGPAHEVAGGEVRAAEDEAEADELIGLRRSAFPALEARAQRMAQEGGFAGGGSILVETVFAWPGIGRLAFDAVLQRDYQVLLGIFFVTSVMVIVFNIITDLVYSLVDPRIEVA